MKFFSATFVFKDGNKTWHVTFIDGAVKLWWSSQTQQGGTFRFANDNRRWKPCASHAEDLIRLATTKPPRCNQARQRVAKTRPELRVVQ